MKINILDAGLKFRAGHHYDYDRKLAKYLAEAGHDLQIYGFSGMSEETRADFSAFGKVVPLFTRYHYEPPQRMDYFAGELVVFQTYTLSLIKDLAKVRKADLWLWPSLRSHQLNACAQIGLRTPMVGCIHDDPGIEARSIDAMLWRLALLSAYGAGVPFTVGALETEIRHQFMSIVPDGKFVIFPHPADGPPLEKAKTSLKRIGFFGFQRREKGTGLMGHLLSRLVDDGYEIVFHDSNGENGKIQHPGIEVLQFVEDLADPISQCDLVVLSYDVAGYRTKGSGVLALCLALGVPVIGPYATIPGRLIEQYQVGPLFPNLNSNAVYAAIKVAERNFPAFARNAHAIARQYVKRNGSARYAERFLEAARR